MGAVDRKVLGMIPPAEHPPTSTPASRKPIMKWLSAVVVAGVVVTAFAPFLRAQLSQGGTVKGFKLPEFYEPVPGKVPPNRLKTLVTGAEAKPLSKSLVAVQGMRIETYQVSGATNAIAKAPQCMINLDLRQVSSTGRLELLTGNGRLYMEGNEGFFCRLTNFNLVVSNRVRTVIHHNVLTNTP